MKKLRYICAQPAIRYYAWHVEVMLNNFLKNGISPEQIHILVAVKPNEMPLDWDNLRKKYKDVGFYFYDDTRINKQLSYVSSVRPHILAKHFTQFPELKNDAIFYHDCDMVFTKKVNWDKFLDDDIWYLSDTVNYIDSTYIKSKKYGIYEKMCEIIGISMDIPEQNKKDSGGAQYIMKNIDAAYWEKVEKDCVEMYTFFNRHLIAFPKTETYNPIQMWTADMWAVLWNAWYFGHTVKVVPEMKFAWPMHEIDDWDKCDIFHNAGVVAGKHDNLFNKTIYHSSLPYNISLNDFNEHKCSYRYVQEIVETVKTSCLL